jgi:malate dehydrogenase (oxaloacetate-decarboxylating)
MPSDKARDLDELAMRRHAFYRGKMQVMPKCAVRDLGDFAIWYTPGVAAPCKAIHADPQRVYDYTNKANSIAVVSDGTRVLGLGDIGPEAGLPVMEGKALLFKFLGGVDAVPICLRTKDAAEIIETVKRLEPSFGGINLEDISQPKCFRVFDTLREELTIPVWHDDQHGTATAFLAGLHNGVKVVGKSLQDVRIALIGMGAANVAVYRLLLATGIDPAQIVACDSKGVLHRGRGDIEAVREEYVDKWRVCTESNPEGIEGGIADALRGADVCAAFSSPGPDIIRPEWVRGMARDAIVFACANPVPEIWPAAAREAGARIVGTGRSDFPNQLNNSLAFPGIFRGILDVRARTITDGVAIAAARELAAYAEARGMHEEDVLPRMDEWEVFPRVAVAVAMQAQQEGTAALRKDRAALHEEATQIIRNAREATALLMRDDIIRAFSGSAEPLRKARKGARPPRDAESGRRSAA